MRYLKWVQHDHLEFHLEGKGMCTQERQRFPTLSPTILRFLRRCEHEPHVDTTDYIHHCIKDLSHGFDTVGTMCFEREGYHELHGRFVWSSVQRRSSEGLFTGVTLKINHPLL